MTLVADYPLTSTFAGVSQLQANGTIDTGDNLPNGIGTSLYISGGRMVSTITEDDTETATGIRSEVKDAARANGAYFYNFSLTLADDFNPLVDYIMLMQIHDTPDGGDGAKTVPFALCYEQSGDFSIRVPSQTLPAEGATARIIPIMKAVRGREYVFTLHALWSITATGFRHFYVDRQPVFKETNIPTCYDDVTGNYLKCGVYDATHNAQFGTATAFYRNIKVYSGNDGFETAMGGNPIARTQLLDR
jgi:hypothetical protein